MFFPFCRIIFLVASDTTCGSGALPVASGDASGIGSNVHSTFRRYDHCSFGALYSP
jgi:hypothetical protein